MRSGQLRPAEEKAKLIIQPIDYFLVASFALALLSTAYDGRA